MTHMVTVVVWVQRVARITTGSMTRVVLNIILRVTPGLNRSNSDFSVEQGGRSIEDESSHKLFGAVQGGSLMAGGTSQTNTIFVELVTPVGLITPSGFPYPWTST
ncbi:hypothetical protein DFJ58DRAFT_839586 [Suillus subalutaceus]|uniref:uncharacterized protein n=1 Tax=Suillus subalutaceus TaxID=48586 RepID=UPI001B879D8B|nr:uncharacterized protein DFJ58DRAFT_839586 [Suillus subalutaceus]KAG1861754.1 hypothetical protein DFJ58DRAFT_839586 [Suillus subalutaceus]